MVQKTDDFERHTWYRKPISAMFQGTGKLSKMYTHTTLSMGWRPRSGRHPIEIVPCVYILDSFPVPWNMAEIVRFLYHVCLSVLSPIPRALPGLDTLNPTLAMSGT